MKNITLFTIGFAGKKAEEFFPLLRERGVKCLMDIRLHNTSQLAGYTKKEDLAYFTRVICGIDYLHRPDLAPTEELFEQMKGGKLKWADFSTLFRSLLAARKVEAIYTPTQMDGACLLCSEASPNKCHRKIVAEYLQDKWGKVDICHL
ncbi:MAG: DUF488 domain-containing protein [Syntrophales bacterium]|nr:DUF488 domain-containing protein [Syntrophales bacterium]